MKNDFAHNKSLKYFTVLQLRTSLSTARSSERQLLREFLRISAPDSWILNFGNPSELASVAGGLQHYTTFSCLVVNLIHFLSHGKTGKDLQGLGSMAKGSSIRTGDLFTDGKSSKK
jgi:hypothetical protein